LTSNGLFTQPRRRILLRTSSSRSSPKVNHRLARARQPPRRVTPEASCVLHSPTALGEPSRQCSRRLKPARFCGKEARSRSWPLASSIAPTATEPLWGSTPISTFMSARASVSVGPPSPPSACAKGIPTSGSASIPLLSHSARLGHQRDASRERANPPRAGDRKFASDPCVTGTLEA